MTIYTSEKVMPYVYMGIHRETGEFYIGSRTALSLAEPSHIDLFQYKTSSKYVKPRFSEFDWHIVAEFFDADDAYAYEQQLIYDHLHTPGLLNRVCYHGKRTFSVHGCRMSDEIKLKMSLAKKGIPQGPNPLKANNGKKNGMYGRTRTEDEKAKIRATRSLRTTDQDILSYSRVKSEEEIAKMIANRPSCVGINNPNAKHIIITTPSGEEIHCHGDFRMQCTKLGILWETMRTALWKGRPTKSGYSARYG